MGRLHRNKGFDVLLAAMADLPDAWICLAGAGPEEADLRQRAQALGVADRVRFLGWWPAVGGLLQACDILVCPSRHEPLGNVVLEAWAAARPVVATVSQGPGQLIAHQENGILVPSEEPKALADAIRCLASDPERSAMLAEAGHAAYERAYSKAVVIQQYVNFFQQVLGSCAASPG